MNHVLSLRALQRGEALGKRKPGYVAACLKTGRVTPDGLAVEFTEAQFNELRKVFAIDQEKKRFGLGDLVGAVATPIARALNLDCVDKETGQLKPSSPCQKRKDALNNLVPFKT